MQNFLRLFVALAIVTLGFSHTARAADGDTAYVVAYFETAFADKDKVRALARKLSEAVAREDGNLRFEVLQRVGQPDQFAILEAWKDKAALTAHAEAASTREFREKLGAMLRSSQVLRSWYMLFFQIPNLPEKLFSRGGERRFDGPPEIELEKLVGDSLYLDNQAHIVVSRMRDMDSGTRSQLRRLYNAVRRATRAPENERQHEFVMLRARLAYTIARHGLRSLDQLERLLLQVTRKNDARGYERFRDLFEAIVAYNE